jgi:hypothetical protein
MFDLILELWGLLCHLIVEIFISMFLFLYVFEEGSLGEGMGC